MYRFCSITLTVLGGALLLSAGPALAQTEAGIKVYAAQKCSICHSIAGQGNKKLPLDTVGAKLTADQIREWIVAPVEAAQTPTAPANDDCLACHGDSTATRGNGSSIAVALEVFGRSTHGTLACVDCHADLAKNTDWPPA